MFHKAIELELLEGTMIKVTFQTGEIKSFNMASLFEKYPVFLSLMDRRLFLKGELRGGYGIVWNDDIDLSVETIYENGALLSKVSYPIHQNCATALLEARAAAGLSQKELAKLAGIDQSDISKIERGVANPSINTLERLAKALNKELKISFE